MSVGFGVVRRIEAMVPQVLPVGQGKITERALWVTVRLDTPYALRGAIPIEIAVGFAQNIYLVGYMAKQETVIFSYSCDICGKDAEGSHTITYGNGNRPRVYEIDLCAADAKKLAKAQDALIAVLAQGRNTGGSRQRASSGSRARPTSKRSSGGADAGVIREWARSNGYEVSDRGRISAGLREAYAEST
jgi:Lsr2